MRVNIITNSWRGSYPEEGESWGLNYEFAKETINVAKIFLMDGVKGLSWVREAFMPEAEVREKMNAAGVPIITPFVEEGIEKSKAYPLSEIKARYKILYFKSTVAYMLAYAAMHGYDDIHLYGVTCGDHLAYIWERPAIEHWLGVLVGQGAKITSHDEDTRLYGGRASFGGEVLYGYELGEEDALKEVERRKQ